MTEMQVKYHANEIAEEKNRIEQAKLKETERANLVNEQLTDLANLAKYGYTKYNPLTETGIWRKSNVAGQYNLFRDILLDMMAPLSSVIGGISKGK